MSKSDLQVPPAARRSLEDILTRALLAYFAETPVHSTPQPVAEDCQPPLRRLLLLAHPGLAGDCLFGSLREHGYGVAMYSLYDVARFGGVDADLVILSISQCQPDTLAVIRQRVDEIRGSSLNAPIMAIVENAERNAVHDLAAVGFSALVVGPLSVKIALATVHLVLLGGSQVSAEIYLNSCTRSERDGCEAAEETGLARKPVLEEGNSLSIRHFTNREVALLARLREGMQNKVIAHELGIAESTVKVHLRNIMAKLHASNRTQVASMLAGYESLFSRPSEMADNLDSAPARTVSD